MLAVEEMVIEVEGIFPVAEHFQDDLNEAEAVIQDLFQVLFTAVVLQYFDGQELADDSVGQELPVLQPQQFPHEHQSNLGVLVDLSYLGNYFDHSPQIRQIPEHPHQDSFQAVLQDVFGLLSSHVLPLNNLLPNWNPQLHRLHNEVQNWHCLARLHQLHLLQLVLSLLLGCPQQARLQVRSSRQQLPEHGEGFGETNSEEGLDVLVVGLRGEVGFKDQEEGLVVAELGDFLVEFADESEDVLGDGGESDEVVGDEFDFSGGEGGESEQFVHHLLFDELVELIISVVELGVEEDPVALHGLGDSFLLGNPLQDLVVELLFRSFLEVVFDVDEQDDILFGEGVVAEQAVRTDFAGSEIGGLVLLDLDIEDPGLHDLKFVVFFVVLEHGLEGEVQSSRTVEEVAVVEGQQLLPTHLLQHFCHVFVSHIQNGQGNIMEVHYDGEVMQAVWQAFSTK